MSHFLHALTAEPRDILAVFVDAPRGRPNLVFGHRTEPNRTFYRTFKKPAEPNFSPNRTAFYRTEPNISPKLPNRTEQSCAKSFCLFCPLSSACSLHLLTSFPVLFVLSPLFRFIIFCSFLLVFAPFLRFLLLFKQVRSNSRKHCFYHFLLC